MNYHDVAKTLDPFRDNDGETFIQVQVQGSDRLEQIALDTHLGRALVRSVLCPMFAKGFATDRETRVAVEVIEGIAFLKQRRQAEANVDLEIDRKPLAKALLSVARHGGTKKELSQLLSMLHRAAQREGIDIRKGNWPASEDALGKQLSLLVGLLKRKGVTITRHSTERPRTWSISVLCDEGGGRDVDVTDASCGTTLTTDNSDTSLSISTGLAGLNDDEVMAQINGGEQ